MSHYCKVEVGVEIQPNKMVHLLAVPLEGPPDLHEHLFRALTRKKKTQELLMIAQGVLLTSDRVILRAYTEIPNTPLNTTHLYISVPVQNAVTYIAVLLLVVPKWNNS